MKIYNTTIQFPIFLIRAYQIILGPFLGGRCRYYPSCSNYAIEAYQTHSVLRATRMTVKRLSCCHPLSAKKNYYDPVPMKGVL